jgi:hypothetical protein
MMDENTYKFCKPGNILVILIIFSNKIMAGHCPWTAYRCWGYFAGDEVISNE